VGPIQLSFSPLAQTSSYATAYSLVLGINGWVQRQGTQRGAAIDSPKCNIHYWRSYVALGTTRQRWMSLTTRNTKQGVQKWL